MRHDFAHSNSRDRASAVRKCAKDTTFQFQRPASRDLLNLRTPDVQTTRGDTMASSFNVRDAGAYEQLMGRWSKALAPQFIDFAGIAREQKILDVGCGTGSLTFALAESPTIREIVAIDFSPLFVAAAAERNRDPRITIRQADACALPFEDDRFDAALALLVLHFVPEADKAIAEMRRVVRAGGVVAAAVWDHLGGLPSMRIAVDTLAALSEGGRAPRPLLLPAADAARRDEAGVRGTRTLRWSRPS